MLVRFVQIKYSIQAVSVVSVAGGLPFFYQEPPAQVNEEFPIFHSSVTVITNYIFREKIDLIFAETTLQ
jgi:hypothetical protein